MPLGTWGQQTGISSASTSFGRSRPMSPLARAAYGSSPLRKRPLSPFAQAVTQPPKPLVKAIGGDPDNQFGSQIGRIGTAPQMSDQDLGIGRSPLYGSYRGMANAVQLPDGQVRVHPALPGAVGVPAPQTYTTNYNGPYGPPSSFTSTGRPASAQINTDPNQRISPGSGYDPLRVGLNRARAGMRLNPEEQNALSKTLGGTSAQPTPVTPFRQAVLNPQAQAQLPSPLQQALMGSGALAGSRAERIANSQALLRQRGIERGEARHASRLMRDITAPRNVRTALGGMVSVPGNPLALALMGGNAGSSPLRDALLLGPGNAANLQMAQGRHAAELQMAQMGHDAQIRAAQINANATNPLTGLQAARLAMVQEEVKAGRMTAAQGDKAIADIFDTGAAPTTTGVAGQPSPASPFKEPIGPSGFTSTEEQQLNAMRGNNAAIEQWAVSEGWPPWKVDKAVEEYGRSPIGDAWRSMTSLLRPQRTRGGNETPGVYGASY